jgi:SAM-dependent methyltransferase
MNINEPLPSSYRDPSGFVFRKNGRILRQINSIYAEEYEMLKQSGLYDTLTGKKLLISHEELGDVPMDVDVYKIIRPDEIRTVTYPYEWSFSQLKDAALLTLKIQQESVKFGMSLKDATPFNVLFNGCKPVFIDTASFEKFIDDEPWIAYHQFCKGFLAPLLLASYHGPEMIRLLQQYPDGIPLDLCAKLLPGTSRLSSLALLHIHLPGSVKKRNAKQGRGDFSKQKLERILDHLYRGISALKLSVKLSTWSDYYRDTILSEQYLEAKEVLVREMVSSIPFESAVDLGCNTGQFSILLAEQGKRVISSDFDPLCIERLYQHVKNKDSRITPIITDLMNPSPGVGFDNNERLQFKVRAKGELIMALALIHHLCISHNLPFNKLARFLSDLGRYLLIEFVPKEDEKVKVLLEHREDIFTDYHLEEFKAEFSNYYEMRMERQVPGTSRILCLMEKRTKSSR